MGTSTHQTTLELTDVESRLRKLLLDVAAYINPEKPSELRYTGGWVRDKLLGVGSHDIDVAINDQKGYQFGLKMKEYLEIPNNAARHGIEGVATTDEVAKSKKPVDKSRIVTGLHKIEANPEKSKHLETVTTRVFGLDIDLVNLRKETYTDESRIPDADFGTPEDDALRRDATINAMFYNLQTQLVEDFTHKGMDDMAKKLIRTPLEPYQTFKDDPLRILRLIRFASRLDYNIEESAVEAMKDETIQQALKLKISRERVGVELEKMLRGPDPQYALRLLDEAGLYKTVFTDPITDLRYSPEVELWQPSYKLVAQLLDSGMASNPRQLLFPDADHEYTAWLLSAFIPWFDAPTPMPLKSSGKVPPAAAVLVAREGVKANNKTCEIVGLCVRNAEEISELKTRFVRQQRFPQQPRGAENDPAGRDTLGMAIRKWGFTWRSQAMFSIMLEATTSTKESKDLLNEWSSFLTHIDTLGLTNAYDFKPIVDGKVLASALNTKPGPWMKEALDTIMAWQLRNPDTATASGAIEALQTKQGELTAVLVRHFLQLTIRPLFAKSKSQKQKQQQAQGHQGRVTEQGRRKMESQMQVRRSLDWTEEEAVPLWKDDKESYALDLLGWILSSLNHDLTQQNWPLLIPPLLTLLDSSETSFKILGHRYISMLLQATPPALLSRTGLGEVFHDAIEPSLSYLPTLTPEHESIALLDVAYPAIFNLGSVRFPQEQDQDSEDNMDSLPLSSEHVAFLTTLLHSHILPSLSHISPSSSDSTYPHLTATLLTHTRTLLNTLTTDTIPQLPYLLPVLTSLITTPFISSTPIVLLEATKTLQIIIGNAWPRMWFWHGEVLRAVCRGWIAATEERERWVAVLDKEPVKRTNGDAKGEAGIMIKKLDEVMAEMKMAADMLIRAVEATNAVAAEEAEDETANDGQLQVVDIASVVQSLVEAEPSLVDLFSA